MLRAAPLVVLLAAAVAAALWFQPAPPRPTRVAPISGAAEALVLWNQQRAYPAADLPAEGLAQAVAATRALAAARGAEPTEP